MNYLSKKEEFCTIKVIKFILENYKTKRLFITQNHLTEYFNNYIANNVLELLNLKYRIPDVENSDTKVEANCVYDKYNIEYHNFKHLFLIDDNYTKNKIIEFYYFFINNKNRFENIIEINQLEIVNDPEKFI